MEKLELNDYLNRLIEEKRKKLPEGSTVLGPEGFRPPEAAIAMDEILSAVYGKHNLMPSVEQLVKDIESKKILPWFIEQENRAIACTALIISQNSVEIGRAANHPKFGHDGSLLMLEAVKFHQLNQNLPLLAEVRLADNFEGITGGQASQVTLLEHAGMKPFAIMPAFHHPGPHGPDRQEFFCFSIDQKPKQPPSIFLPRQLSEDTLIKELKESIFPLSQTVFVDEKKEQEIGFQIKTNPPFNLLLPTQDGQSFEHAMTRTIQPFTLAAIPATPKFSSKTKFLIKRGFIPCGFGWEGTPTILMGKLKQGTILAPIGLASDCFSENMRLAILNLERKFKQSLK